MADEEEAGSATDDTSEPGVGMKGIIWGCRNRWVTDELAVVVTILEKDGKYKW
jgi:hypothetical protein